MTECERGGFFNLEVTVYWIVISMPWMDDYESITALIWHRTIKIDQNLARQNSWWMKCWRIENIKDNQTYIDVKSNRLQFHNFRWRFVPETIFYELGLLWITLKYVFTLNYAYFLKQLWKRFHKNTPYRIINSYQELIFYVFFECVIYKHKLRFKVFVYIYIFFFFFF